MPNPAPDPMFTIRGAMSHIHHIYHVAKDKKDLLYVGTASGNVHIWELLCYRELARIKIGSEACLAVFQIGNSFITQEKQGRIKIWTEEAFDQWKLQKELIIDYSGFCKIVGDSGRIFYPENDFSIKIFHFMDNSCSNISSPKPNIGMIMCIKICLLNLLLVAYETCLVLYSVEKLCALSNYSLAPNCPMALDFCDFSSEGVIGFANDILIRFSIENESIVIIAEVKIQSPGVSSLSIHHDGKLLVAGCWNGKIRYFSRKNKLLAVLDHHTETVEFVKFCDTNFKQCRRLLCAGDKQGRLSLWTLYDNQ